MFIYSACSWMCILFYFSVVCLYVYAYAFNPKIHCRSTVLFGWDFADYLHIAHHLCDFLV